MKSLSRVQLFVTPWTVAYQASLSMGFSRQEYWSGLPFPSPGDLPEPGIEPGLLHWRQTLLNVVIASLFIFSNNGSGPKASSPFLSSSNSSSERGVLANEDVTSGH